MKRPAIKSTVRFAAWVAVACLAWSAPAMGAKKAPAAKKGKVSQPAIESAAAPPPPPAEEKPAEPPPAEEKPAEPPPVANELPADLPQSTPTSLDVKPGSTLSWADVVVVPRKAFLKGGRLELAPFTGLSLNDNLIRHYMFGVDLNYFLTDVLWVGLQGQYFIKTLTEREELTGLQYNRIPTLNKYLYGAALNFGYALSYGKFTLVNKAIMHWEIYISAGIGITRTEIIPRNPGNQGFTTDALTPNAGIGSRFFLFDWLTVNFAVRDYILADKFEPTMRDPNDSVATVKSKASSALVNNVMLYAGIGLYLPSGFQYKSPR